MSIRTMTIPLAGFGAPVQAANATIRTLDPGERLRRAGKALAIGFAAALLTLPIPLVHLFFPPAALVGGVVLGARRLGQRELFQQVEGTCPFCGTEQRLGLTDSPFRLPRTLTCFHCRRSLTLGEA
jgi:hypothetical protein